MSDKQHYPNSPSSLARRELCPGSYWAEKDLPSTSSDASNEGTMLHAVMDRLVRDNFGKGPLFDEIVKGLTIEQQCAVIWACGAASQLMWSSAFVECELKIDLREFDETIGGGTADLVIYEPYNKAVIVDWKFGCHPVPPAAGNLQLAAYGVGVMRALDVRHVEVAIIQPRLERVDIAALDPATVTRAKSAAVGAVRPDSKRIPGKEQCHWCKASGACDAQLALATTSRKMLPAPNKESVALIPIQAISKFLAAYEDEEVEAIVGAMKARLMTSLIAGNNDPEWCIGSTRPTRTWAPGAEEELLKIASGRVVDTAELYTPRELKSVAQVEGVLGKSKEVKALMAPCIVELAGRPKLERRKHA